MALLKVDHVTHYFGGLCAVSDFNLLLKPHELLGIIGPNGAGKTTVFNIITGVYRPTEGSIYFNDIEIKDKTPDRITAMGIARTFQNIRLFNELTVLDNIAIAQYAKAAYSPVEALLHIGRYRREEQRIMERSQELLALFKLDGLAFEQSKNLPYGLQRRLEIVRALAAEPRVLLLDEPAAGMNPKEVDELMTFIGWIRKEFNLTIILIEHQMRLVMGICERLVVLDFGATIADGAPHEVQGNERVLTAYLGEKLKV
ncbi:MAG: high-affinity branched-chain amino acid ABC transporter ATP-binding protein LivG [Syntrophus sp. (in: bacteria)]|nr:high-affinity branched-chain amino acid ABC transporter ATP-binding protein LivG [Syntrophus sp. (in: bacteria)]